MNYIESHNQDPAWNLALEQYLFEHADLAGSCFYLWQNANTIVIGRNQNAEREIDRDYVRAHGIRVVRRLSGGGAVYHDLGNLNFTFIADAPEDGAGRIDMRVFCEPIAAALRALGVAVEISGRNDMTVDGKKFSGNAQFVQRGRVLHHGTLLYDSDLTVLGKALRSRPEKIASKGIASVESRVTNLKPYLGDIGIDGLKDALKKSILAGGDPESADGQDPEKAEFGTRELYLTPAQLAEVEAIRAARYASWEWTYGSAPPYEEAVSRRFEGCGEVEARMNVRKGRITVLEISGDFFGNRDVRELAAQLAGCPRERTALAERLGKLGSEDPATGKRTENIPLEDYIHGLTAEEFAQLLAP